MLNDTKSKGSISNYLLNLIKNPKLYGKLFFDFILSKCWYVVDTLLISFFMFTVFICWNWEKINVLSRLSEKTINYSLYDYLKLATANVITNDLVILQLEDYMSQLLSTALLIGICISFAYYFVRWHGSKSKGEEIVKINLMFEVVAPLFGILFFLYQIIAGSLFATTTIEIKKVERLNKEQILVSAVIERGTNWLVAIALDQYVINHKGEAYPFKYHQRVKDFFKFPRRENGLLRLAPGEKATAEFILNIPKDDKDKCPLFLSMSVLSYALLWPVPSESLAVALIPKDPDRSRSNNSQEAADLTCKLDDT